MSLNADICRIFWRYNILYVSERCFESGGRIWDHIFDEVCWCLWILSTFTGAAPDHYATQILICLLSLRSQHRAQDRLLGLKGYHYL